jgi:hypothetical protein
MLFWQKKERKPASTKKPVLPLPVDFSVDVFLLYHHLNALCILTADFYSANQIMH